MKLFKSGQYDPNAHNKLIEINLSDYIGKVIFDRLDHFMKIIDTNSPDTLEKFASKMIKYTTQYLKHETIDDYSPSINPLLSDLGYLKQFPQLANIIANNFLQIMETPIEKPWDDCAIQVTMRTYDRLYFIPMYIALEALIAAIGRKLAISVHQKYITDYSFIHYKKNSKFINLETMYKTRKENVDRPDPWVKIQGLMSESKYVLQNINCLYIEYLEDFEDAEIKYQICCYGDYEGAKRHYNKNIVLTMEHTIAQGDPYCSKVFHDTRADWNLKHPDKEFWDTIETNL